MLTLHLCDLERVTRLRDGLIFFNYEIMLVEGLTCLSASVTVMLGSIETLFAVDQGFLTIYVPCPSLVI